MDKLCPNPFVFLMNNNSGNLSPCCLIHSFDVSASSDTETFWNSDEIKDIRKKMVEGEEVPQCFKCYGLEKNGGNSLRNDLLEKWNKSDYFKELIENIKDNDYEVNQPVSLEVRTGNKCNLKCRMCQPQDSDQIEKEYTELSTNEEWSKIVGKPNVTAEYPQRYFDYVKSILPTLTELRLSGGEPLINDFFYELIDMCIDNGYAKHIHLAMNTNLTRMSESIMQQLCEFKSVNIDISMDGINAVQEYIRYPIKWSKIEKNIQMMNELLKDREHNILITSNISLQVYNILQLPEMIEWMIDNNVRPISTIVHNPAYLSISNMPTRMKKEAIERIEAYIEMVKTKEVYIKRLVGRDWLISRLKSIINKIEEDTSQREIEKFLVFTKILDEKRSQSLMTSLPEVYEFYRGENSINQSP